jgi:hypothetical protein
MSAKPTLTPGLVTLGRAVTGIVAALIAALVVGAAPAHAAPAAPDVPSTIAVVGDFKPYLVGHAVGWQVHTCKPTATGYGWSFDGPAAALYGDNGKLLATHASGPSWTARDGSSVVGQVVDRAVVSTTAVPWLLLTAGPQTGAPAGRLTDPHPPHRHDRRADTGRRRVHLGLRRRDAVGALHRRLRLLEGDRRRRLTHRPSTPTNDRAHDAHR